MKNLFARRATLALGILLACSSLASAHAFLDRSEPKVGSAGAAPTEVRIWFTQQPEPAFSKIQVFDSGGNQVDMKDTHAGTDDKKLLILSLPKLPAGTYKVVWKVLSVDTHRTGGDFKFTVE